MTIDLEGYKITKGFIFEFPKGAVLYPGEHFILVKDLYSTAWQSVGDKILPWTEGSLSNQGEKIKLSDKYGIIVDQVDYKSKLPWPPASYNLGEVLVLKSSTLDNHFPESWTTSPYTGMNENLTTVHHGSITIYPNPSSGYLHVNAPGYDRHSVEIYDISGRLIFKILLSNEADAVLDLNHLEDGTYLIRCGNSVQKLILMK